MKTKKSKRKKVEGKINNQVFYCYVLSFDEIMEKVIANKDIKLTI